MGSAILLHVKSYLLVPDTFCLDGGTLYFGGHMNNISNTPENIFRLLVPATDATPPDAPLVELCGSPWVLTEYGSILEAPTFTCVSYSWGQGRTENMLEGGQLMSDRTIPAIEATIKSLQPLAIWVDSLCLPSKGPTREACLLRMGAIYRSAANVCAVLSESCVDLVNQIRDTNLVSPEALFSLESDDWITRSWTYQETANNQHIYFIAQGGGDVAVADIDFLNAVLTSTTAYKKAHELDSINLALQLPRVDSLENMIGEHTTAGLLGRPAYQAMSEMHRRFSEQTEGFLHALIGAFSPLSLNSTYGLHPAEYFMQVCEVKGDYSFIYCAAPRSEVPGRSWRPMAGHNPPLTSLLNVYGNGQSGCLKATHLQLNNMSRMIPRPKNFGTVKAIGAFLESDIANAVLERLKQKGFSGCGDYLELEDGFFFPQSTFTRTDDIFVAASEDVQWTNGGPGLLLCSNGTDINHFCDVGVFIGRFPKTCESINVG